MLRTITGRTAILRQSSSRPTSLLLRTFSTKSPKIYDFNQIKKLVQQPIESKTLVDVREPEELKEYAMPTAINIPLKTAPGALSLSSDEFFDIFHFEKPPINNELIFFCQKGIRAQTAEELARSYGYENTGIYPGSIKEWLEKNGKDIKPTATFQAKL
ncbi:thiosulfate sulfurtransferase RDL2 NDAI_0E00770 [Naumovozyma dairenensis CBS 421]|uniref:Rhodanese domain-containing protein n=1 Tax=Naumovozyma dairenensis (strain ATCC 10597 / BCRC 20456 / CBS 421 / NBRC 0211 / NRRL Y-12639) TaxID=1071378 RepID=G0WAX3_NAUDC|nr:hypothetical protein NDAI_0E00770 [Naumovozyma dairenensis CBS 421]CCD24893.1 hypothetical protein NDAI_0E00770 [Naumovozyma dairenensis CBS 421]